MPRMVATGTFRIGSNAEIHSGKSARPLALNEQKELLGGLGIEVGDAIEITEMIDI